MDKLFELSAELTLDTAAFLQEAARAETSAREMQRQLARHASAAASSLTALQSTAGSAWQSIARNIQSAIDKTREFLALGGQSAAGAGAALKPHATGLPYVPYDNYAASLHRGEAVLTALEAARWREGAAPAPATLPPDLSETLRQALSGVQVVLDGEAVGTLVAPAVSAAMEQSISARRYAG